MILTAAMDWQSLGDVQYRKWEVYAMLWDNVDLEALLVACAPFGGPIATVALGGGPRSSLFIYTASGTLRSHCSSCTVPFSTSCSKLSRMNNARP